VTEAPQKPSSVQAYARRLSLRLWSIHALRGLWAAAGAAALATLFASFVTEPVLTRSSALWVWSCIAVASALALVWVLSPLRHYRGTRIAEIVAGADPALSHRLRSALELAALGPNDAKVSRELLSAHVADVQRALDEVPAQRVLPWSRLLHRSVVLAIGCLALFAFATWRGPGFSSFVHALVAPASERNDGTRIASVVASVHVRLAYPSYLGREATLLEDPREITAPAGTTLELTVKPRFAAERGRIIAHPRTLPLTAAEGGVLQGKLSLHSEADLHIELESHGVRYEDPRAIALHVTPDATPTVHIDEPRNGSLAPPGEVISLRFVASDDVGVANVQLHARVADGGAEKLRQLFSAIDDGGPLREVRSGAEIVPEELGAREGDTLVIWLEARDADLVSGPHVGKSQEISLEVARPGEGLSEFIPSLQQIADGAVDLLGRRLEQPVSKDPTESRQRFEALNRGARAWLGELDALLRHAESARTAPLDVDQLRGMRKRNEHLLLVEAGLHAPITRGFAEREGADARHVDEIERDVILLTDMLARAHVDEAKAIADELRELKKHIESLLDELGKTHSPDAERELMREIAKAQRRLAELAQSLSRMATRVPGEFVNRDAVQKEAAESALTSLQRAVENHDLRSAADHLDALAKQIDELAAQIGQGGLRLQESRFGPRDQAMAEARQKLGMLGTEQNRLTERSGSVTRGALERGQHGQSDARARALAPQAEALERESQQLAEGPGNGFDSAAANRAAERYRDARDALRAGDLAQARGAAQSAERGLRETAAELDNEAHMFPGHHGEVAQRAAQARQAAAEAERFSDSIDRAMPELSQQLSDADKQKMRADADAQKKAADAAEQLKQQFQKGPDGLPLSPDATEALDQARHSMQKAQRALERGQPDEANREQQQASDRLQRLSKQLAEEQRGGRGGKGKREGEYGDLNRNAPVHIPGAEEWKGPIELRRKLLDAMQESAPAEYEAAIKRYYQELMR
jgi:hypothetical protein